ncbi:hypothetical protein QMK19_38880 [Streptomyces sp. H10-C2]|uniref:hypothetical protein n=1 Tax=unclassified Streptomyces TaxID=2593676 RepID=UPI0024BB99CF|nr:MULTISPECIES: hypothetical protein [unclassified Streptomyces]MDJ0347141.1 hypothetical protein [Streptomyces sp. PH10-H1]MDJ0375400.1 hypothetical protein [Streptomyces sp. H10-C2]
MDFEKRRMEGILMRIGKKKEDHTHTIRARKVQEVTDTTITLRPENDPGAITVTPESVQKRAAEYGLKISKEEAAESLDSRLRHRGWR